MAGYDLMTAGKSPAEIRRMKRRRRMLGAGMEGKAALHADMSKKDAEITKAEAGVLGITGGREPALIVDHSDRKIKTKTATKVKFGVGPSKTIMHNGRSMANVTRDQLVKAGFPTNTKGLRAYVNAWDTTGKRPTKATATPVKPITTTTTTVKPVASGTKVVKPEARTTVKPVASGTKVVKPEARTTTPPPLNAAEAREKAKAKRLRDAADIARLERVAAMERAEGNPATRRGTPRADPQANPYTRRGPALLPTPDDIARRTRAAEVELAERNPDTRRGTRNLGGRTRAAEVELAERNPDTRRGTSRDNFQSRVDRAKRTGNPYEWLPEMPLKKGGLVKKSAAKKPAAKKPSRKKSIDGLARKGKTRAKHR